MEEHIGKNFPEPTVETEKFWQGCRKRELLIQQCNECGHYQFYPRIMCTDCMSRNIDWMSATGRGKVKTYTIIYRAISKAYAKDVPYVVAIIELEEGPSLMSNVVGCKPEEVKVGQEVMVTFEDWSEEISIPKFTPLPLS
ncbi:Zn-ribbon domain-containing OB-fold protein [Oceanobacillus senegalensis]|uniref:Zn-ribbon domain-containing OB-fold protein n=1 Tax=Oceanobacillus senegalensis TaxID=1936063 RepID=UPI000A30E394|nr:Zn-ribbon domain-containing OB-fold protein [Oceanobacillus senegalensis]